MNRGSERGKGVEGLGNDPDNILAGTVKGPKGLQMAVETMSSLVDST